MLQANGKSREVFRDRILNTDLSEFSKASGGEGVEVLFADFCAQDSGHKGSRETIRSCLLIPGILDHRLLQQRERPSRGPSGGGALPPEDIP